MTKAADVALYDAKALGKGRFCFYEPNTAKPVLASGSLGVKA